jgi:hypothetical protein
VIVTALAMNAPASGANFFATSGSTGSFAAAATWGNTLEYSATGPSATRTSSGTLVVTYPASTQPNDLLLLIEVNAANQNITTPTGWTQLADAATSSPAQFRFTIWWKLAGVETSVSLPVNTNSSGASGWVVRYRDADGYPPNPTTATATVAAGTWAASTAITPSPDVTTNSADAAVISIVAIRAGNTLSLSTPWMFTLQNTSIQSTIGQARAIGIADRTGLSSGFTPPSPQWAQSGTAAQWAFATVAFAT